jgi:hypothetical protein
MTPVVPLPQKGSSTVSPTRVTLSTHRSAMRRGMTAEAGAVPAGRSAPDRAERPQVADDALAVHSQSTIIRPRSVALEVVAAILRRLTHGGGGVEPRLALREQQDVFMRPQGTAHRGARRQVFSLVDYLRPPEPAPRLERQRRTRRHAHHLSVDDRLAEIEPQHAVGRQPRPQACAYLRENKQYLSDRENGRFKGPSWYQFGRSQNTDLMLMPKILVPDIADRAAFALDEDGQFAFASGYGITLKAGVTESLKYVLGLLNSSALNFFLKKISTPLRGGFFRYFTQCLEQLPIAKPAKSTHDQIVRLVDAMLDAKRRLALADTDRDRTYFVGKCASTQAQINRRVYDLYALTEEEIAPRGHPGA